MVDEVTDTGRGRILEFKKPGQEQDAELPPEADLNTNVDGSVDEAAGVAEMRAEAALDVSEAADLSAFAIDRTAEGIAGLATPNNGAFERLLEFAQRGAVEESLHVEPADLTHADYTGSLIDAMRINHASSIRTGQNSTGDFEFSSSPTDITIPGAPIARPQTGDVGLMQSAEMQAGLVPTEMLGQMRDFAAQDAVRQLDSAGLADRAGDMDSLQQSPHVVPTEMLATVRSLGGEHALARFEESGMDRAGAGGRHLLGVFSLN